MASKRLKFALFGFCIGITTLFIILPYISVKLDKVFDLPEPLSFPFNLIGILFIVGGISLSLECIHLFFTLGKGTPSPFMPPKLLVTTGPYIPTTAFNNSVILLSFFYVKDKLHNSVFESNSPI